MIKRIFFTAIAAFALSVAAQAADMESGTWVMNVAKSTGRNGILPRSDRYVASMDGGYLIMKRHSVNKDGVTTTSNSIVKHDGVARPSIGNGPDAVGMLFTGTRSDDFHRKGVWIAITGKVRITMVVVISPDGKVKTNTYTRVDKDGKTSNYVAVYDKQ